jgi:hypothetical protein
VTRPIDAAASSITTRRRTVRLTSLTDDAGVREAPPATEAGAAPRAGRGLPLPTSRDDWLVLAERVVGDWAATLRAALLLLLAVAAVIMLVGVAFGAGPAMATAFLALLVFLAGRRRSDATRR